MNALLPFRSLRLAVVLALLMSTPSARAAWTPNDAQQEALQAINAIRKKMNLPSYTQDEHLSKSAMAHAAFADRYDMRHDEKPGLKGFTGADIFERVRVAGYTSRADVVSELINYRMAKMGVTMCLRDLFDAPYHRTLWMHPGSMKIGAGTHNNTIVVDFAGLWKEGTVVSPYDGQTDVPVSWSGRENPDPRHIWNLPRTIGYPIVYHWEAPTYDQMTSFEATLSDEEGHPVDIVMNLPQNDLQLKYANESLILPLRPLRPHTKYMVKVSARAKSGKDISRQWHFTTGGKAIEDRRESQTEAEAQVSFAVEPASDDAVTARVINLDPSRRRFFTVKARNGTGDLLASARLRIDPGTSGSVTLKAAEPIFSVVLDPENENDSVPITKLPNVRVYQ